MSFLQRYVEQIDASEKKHNRRVEKNFSNIADHIDRALKRLSAKDYEKVGENIYAIASEVEDLRILLQAMQYSREKK